MSAIRKYTAAEVRLVAVQIYGEMRHALGNNPFLINELVRYQLDYWSPETEESFRACFPGEDPALARLAGSYLLDNFAQIADANTTVSIPKEELRRFGFRA
ncbi:MAG: hypothetical protein HYY37_04670 [Candidatus Aenigmarchaeota archaeon]|nr:hypothetical protein [Candidatus Aenigmarchaeota archaeon]